MNITERQREAVTWGQGPLLVLAGPGSGKTFVITRRVLFLTEQLGVRPERILVVTFSRAAAKEMEERYATLRDRPAAKETTPRDRPSGEKAPGRVTFGTFHSFFFGILRTAYGYSADQVAGEEERKEILYSLIRERRMDSDDIR